MSKIFQGIILVGLIASSLARAQLVNAGQLAALHVSGGSIVAELAVWSTINLTELTQSLGCFPTNSQAPQNTDPNNSKNYSYVEVHAGSLAAGETITVDTVICSGDAEDMALNPVVIFEDSSLQGTLIAPDGSRQALALGTRIYTNHKKSPMLSLTLLGLQAGVYRVEITNIGRKVATIKELDSIVRLRKPGTY